MNLYKQTQVNLSILCKSATLPDKSIGTQETLRHRYLPDGEVDYGNEVSFTFICDPNFLDRMIIEAWMRFIHTSDVSSFTEIPQVSNQKRETQVFRFYDEFATGQVRIHVLKKRWFNCNDISIRRMLSNIHG